MTLETPCLRICQLDADQQYCIGCFRTLHEIREWRRMPPENRSQVLQAIPVREKQHQARLQEAK